ncbi:MULTISPECIES: PqqD family protein [unclassified Bradyrhizobium]|uniref:PqqD family protein n=1 Tax=unclassified Bradyrhizobium TaxID=2631580 RepID=UPI0028E4414E|nr:MULTISPECIES: PqqD family protein [unclassified Bradyrhizobium]
MSLTEGREILGDDWRVTRVRINHQSVVSRRKGNKLVVYEFDVGGFYVLNASAQLIFEQIDGDRTLGQIADRVEGLTSGTVSKCDVVELVSELQQLKVILTERSAS